MAENMSDFIPDNKFIPDPTSKSSGGGGFIPDDQFTPDDDNLLEQGKAAVEGLERGITGGLSDIYHAKIAPNILPESMVEKPEDISRRMEQFPVTSGASNMIGGGALLAATGGLGRAVPALTRGASALGLGTKAAGTVAKVAAMGAEGGLFGAANAVTDYALGDPELNAQKVVAHIGTGALLGTGLGILSRTLESVLPVAARKSGQLAEAIRGKFSPSEASSVSEGAPIINGSEIQGQKVVDAPYTGVKPTSYQQIADKVKNAKYTGESLELPGKAHLADATSRVEMMNPVHPLQLDSLGDQASRDAYNTFKEMPGAEGDALRGYESLQKNELNSRTNNEIELVAPESKITSDAVAGGNKAIDSFTEQYQKERGDLGKVFEQFKKTPLEFEGSALTNAVNHMTDAVPGVAHMFDTASEEGVKILPYKTSWGIDKSTYNAVKEAVESLKENPTDFESLQNIRNGLKQHVDVMAQGQAPQQIRALGKAMMDFMQEAVERSLPEAEVREIFKRYAINEQERQVIEKAFGASVGSQEFGAISKIKPEMIGDKIFSNTATVEAAKNILEPKKFNEILANWLSENKARVTDKGVFSSNKWGTFLRKNEDALNAAFKDNPSALQKIKDYTTIMRMLPDAPSINPSGTAKTLMGMLKNVHGTGDAASAVFSFLKDKTVGKVKEQVALAQLNEQLAGKAAKASVLSEVSKMVEKTNEKIASGAKSVFNQNSVRGAVISGGTKMLNDSYDKNVKNIQKFANNPEQLLDHIASHSDTMYDAAPNITQGIHNSLIASVQFLNSKIPKPTVELPLSQKWEPTNSQKNTFNRYFVAVNDPMVAFKQIKDGSLSNETMDALKSTQPHLLQEMQEKVIENMDHAKASSLNYATKIALSKFLGQPLDESLMPGSLASYQGSFANPPSKPSQMVGKTTSGGMKNMDFSGRARTRTEMNGSKA